MNTNRFVDSFDEIRDLRADGGIIGLDGNANVVYSFNSAGMYRASVDKNGKLSVAIYK